jgi:hypothetical protein
LIETLVDIPEQNEEKKKDWIQKHLSHLPPNRIHILVAARSMVVFVVFGAVVRSDPHTPPALRSRLVNLVAAGLGERKVEEALIGALQTIGNAFEPSTEEEPPLIEAVWHRELDPGRILFLIAPGLLCTLLFRWCYERKFRAAE